MATSNQLDKHLQNNSQDSEEKEDEEDNNNINKKDDEEDEAYYSDKTSTISYASVVVADPPEEKIEFKKKGVSFYLPQETEIVIKTVESYNGEITVTDLIIMLKELLNGNKKVKKIIVPEDLINGELIKEMLIEM